MHKQQGCLQTWEYCQAQPIQKLRRASPGVNWSWSQCIKSHYPQTSSGNGLPSHFWNRNIVRSISPGLRRKRIGLLLSSPKSSFQMKVNTQSTQPSTRCYCAWLACKLAWPGPPIENLWGIVKRKMRDTRPNNADDLKAAIKATWASITPAHCHGLIASMPRCIDELIHAKGGSTKYWVHWNEHTFQKPDISV